MTSLVARVSIDSLDYILDETLAQKPRCCDVDGIFI